MFEPVKIKYLESLRKDREQELERLTKTEEGGINIYLESKELLEKHFFSTEFNGFKVESEALMQKILEKIGWENGNTKEIKKVVENRPLEISQEEANFEKAVGKLQEFARVKSLEIPPILRLLTEIDCLRRRIVALKREAGLLREG